MIYVVASSMVDYLNSSSKIYKSDLMIKGLASASGGDDLIKDISEITDASFLYSKTIPVTINENELEDFTVISNYGSENIDDFFQGVKVDEKTFARLKEDEIILDSDIMKNYKLKIYDTVTIEYKLENSKVKQTYKIADKCNSTYFVKNRCMGIVSHENYKKVIDSRPSYMFINANTNIKQLKKSIENRVTDMKTRVIIVDEYIQEGIKKNLSVLSMVFILIGIGVLLSFVGIVNNQLISFIQRGKELAVLYATSMSKAQLMQLIIFETVISFISSSVLSIATCFSMLSFIEDILSSMNIYFMINFSLSAVLNIFLVGLISALFTNIYPIRKIRRMNVIAEIKYE
jgi:ABC-type antimicrobial peptide transport system permease subunit